jgi:hypothetical protein
MNEESALLIEIARNYSDIGIGGDMVQRYFTLLKRREILATTVERASDTPKFKKIPRLLRSLQCEIDAMELRLKEYVRARDLRIFSVGCDPQELREALDRCDGPGVTLGFNGGATLTLDSHHVVKVTWGYGNGLGVVGVADLWEAAKVESGMLVIELDREGWETWSDVAEKVNAILMSAETPTARRFGYFTKES